MNDERVLSKCRKETMLSLAGYFGLEDAELLLCTHYFNFIYNLRHLNLFHLFKLLRALESIVFCKNIHDSPSSRFLYPCSS